MALLRLIKKNLLNLAIVICFFTTVKLAFNYYVLKTNNIHSRVKNIEQVVIHQNSNIRNIKETQRTLESNLVSNKHIEPLSSEENQKNNDITELETQIILTREAASTTGIETLVPPTIDPIDKEKSKSPGVVNKNLEVRTFENMRLLLWFQVRCVVPDPYTGLLIVSHCIPEYPHIFSLLSTGVLMYIPSLSTGGTLSGTPGESSSYDSKSTCVVEYPELAPLLALGPCDKAIKFNFTSSFYLQTTEPQPATGTGKKRQSKPRCLSPVSDKNVTKANKMSCLGSPVALTECTSPASKVDVMSDADLRSTRRELINAAGNTTNKCVFPACRLNTPLPPLVMINTNSPCREVAKCVTVLTKTAKRPHLVTRLADSIRNVRGEDLNIISYDDGPDDLPTEAWEKINQYPQLDYIIGSKPDMGISVGRNLALELVKTPYFLLVDDDHVFTNRTNIEKMIDILERTDAVIVGGKFEGHSKFGGRILFGNYLKTQTLSLFSGLCERNVTEFPGCEQCDSTSNIFLAKTQDIRDIGGWTPELKVTEHTDFFVKVKAAKKKVVYCDDIEVANKQEKQKGAYHNLRYGKERKEHMVSIVMSRYNVNGFYWCSRWNVDSVTGNPACRSYKQKDIHC